jgi:hypothetical protein
MGASAAINSCAADMANWLLMQLNNGKFNGNSIVSSSVLRETRKSQMVVRDVNSKIFSGKHFNNYGLGWASSDYYGKRVYEHSGGANGFVTKTEFMPEENLGVLVYTNSDANSLYDALPKQIIEAYLNLTYRNISQIYFDAGTDSRENELRATDSLMALSAGSRPEDFETKRLVGYYQNLASGATQRLNVDHYTYSTAGNYFEALSQFQFTNLWLKPLLGFKKAYLKELLIANAYYIHNQNLFYNEIGYGLDGVIKVLRLEAIANFNNGQFNFVGLRININSRIRVGNIPE